MATIELDLAEYRTLIDRQNQLENDLAAARAANIISIAHRVDERLNRLAGHAVPLVKFAMAHLSPEAVHGWPRRDLEGFIRLLAERPMESVAAEVDEASWLEDARAFVRECEDWDGRRERKQVSLAQASLAKPQAAYMAHPIGSDQQRPDNIRRAHRWFRYLVEAFPEYAICVPWLPYVENLDESWRKRGLRDDLLVLDRCDLVILVGGRISAGMQEEALRAKELGKRVVDLTHLGVLPPPGAEEVVIG